MQTAKTAHTMFREWTEDYLEKQKKAIASLKSNQVADLMDYVYSAICQESQIFVFGNGGSAANSSHFATDMTKGFKETRNRKVRCISLTDNVPWITAIANDVSYDQVFVDQLSILARPGDYAIGISVSGTSPNVVKGLQWAAQHHMRTVAIIGKSNGTGGNAAQMADVVIQIDDTHYGRVEDVQMMVCHMAAYAFQELDVSKW